MSDINASIVGLAVGLVFSVPCALLIVLLLRRWEQEKNEYVPWSVILARPALPELPAPELAAQSSPLALPGPLELQQ